MKSIILLLLVCTTSQAQFDKNIYPLDSRFAGIDLIHLVKSEYPKLSNNAELISHYSGYYNINPFVISEAFTHSKESNFLNFIHPFYNSLKNEKPLSENQLSEESIQKIKRLMKANQISINIKSRKNISEMPLLDVPFDHDKEWIFNGVHTWTGEDDGSPMSSLDLALNFSTPWGSDTSKEWVTASTSGKVTVFSSCFIRVTHDSGWATDYYHLDNPQVKSGDRVIAGQRLANYANNLSQATCQGGHSQVPHLHFSLLFENQRQNLQNREISRWNINSGAFSYDSDPSRMWLKKDNSFAFAFNDSISHLNGDNIIDYRYNGIYTAPEITGHGLNISIAHLPIADSNEFRNVLFLAFYSYDDNKQANFYAGNIDYDVWRGDEFQTVEMIQTSGGNLSDLQPIEFSNDVIQAGSIQIKFNSCSEVEAILDLREPISNEQKSHSLTLSKIVGVPDYVCQAESLTPNS